MHRNVRSGCPIHLALELIGDRWALLILRDLIFSGARTFKDLIDQSPERIPPNILSVRLAALDAADLIQRFYDSTDARRQFVRLTHRSIALVPVLATLGTWGAMHTHAEPTLAAPFRRLAAGGPIALALAGKDSRPP